MENEETSMGNARKELVRKAQIGSVEKGIKLPAKTKYESSSKYPFEFMEELDSFLLENSTARQADTVCCGGRRFLNKKGIEGMMFVYAKEEYGHRIFLVNREKYFKGKYQ